MRALGLVGLGADVLLGPTGAALTRLMGDSGGAVLVGTALVAWCTAPLALAAHGYRRRDF
jgi:hypothetical protein